MSYLSQLIHKLLAKKAEAERAKFDRLASNPARAQSELLLSTLRREAETGFGRDFHFAKIRSVADFQRHVPILKYENLEPYIERIKLGETDALFHRQKVLMFSLTSGTVGARKFLPVTKRFVKTHQRGWYLWGLGAFSAYPHLCMGPKIGLAGNPDEFRSPANIPCGSISGLTAKLQNPFIRRTVVLPPDTWQINNTHTKYYMAWRFGLNVPVGMWLTPNPSTHLALAKFGDEHREQLIEDVERGVISEPGIPKSLLRARRKLILPNPQRAQELRTIVDHTGHLRPKDVWPGLDLIGCWLGGSVRSYLRFFPEYFGDAAVRDIGLIASEARMTIPLEDDTASGVLEVAGTFFEFIPMEEIDSTQPTVLWPMSWKRAGIITSCSPPPAGCTAITLKTWSVAPGGTWARRRWSFSTKAAGFAASPARRFPSTRSSARWSWRSIERRSAFANGRSPRAGTRGCLITACSLKSKNSPPRQSSSNSPPPWMRTCKKPTTNTPPNADRIG